MSDSINPDRRNFLLQAILFTGGGLILGGAGAMATSRFTVAPPTAASPLLPASTSSLQTQNQIAQLQNLLKSSQDSLAQSQTQLQQTLTKNAELQNSLTEKKTEADKLRTQLAGAQTQLEKYKKLMALFEKLDSVKFDKLVSDGLTAASAGFLTVLAATPLVAAGLEVARNLFDNFERQLVLFRASVDWLKSQIDSLNGNIGVVEAAIGQAMRSLDPLTSRMTQLVDYILANLPFGIGQSVKITLKAINDLYQSLPPLATGATAQVLNVLIDPFSSGEKSLTYTLLKPVREKMFDPSEKLATQFKTLNDIYLRDLHLPVRQAVEDRAKVLDEIAEYRRANSL
jgi:hypothetical protein